MNIIILLLLIIILIVSVVMTCTENLGAENDNVIKGYGHPNEPLEVLLDRIDWSNHYHGRAKFVYRYGIYSVLIAFVTSIIYEPTLDPINMLQATLVVWMFLLGAHSFFSFHSDKFSSYFIDNNLEHIRAKLSLDENVSNLKVNQVKKFPRNSDCTTFIYRNTGT